MSEVLSLSPIAVCGLTGLLVMAIDLLAGRGPRGFLAYISAFGMGISALLVFLAWRTAPSFEQPWLAGILHPDVFAAFFSVLVLISGIAACLIAVHHMPDQGNDGGEAYILIPFSATGAMILVASIDLVTLFLGLEIMSLSVYVLAAQKRSSPLSIEAGLKYFVLGGLASAFLLFGIALLYGTTGKLNMVEVAASLNTATDVAYVAAALLLVAFGFKVAAVPFHMWTPDVYEGAPTPAVAFMAGAVKAAGFAVMCRFLMTTFQHATALLMPDVILVLAIATMVFGNVLGIVQKNIKRILAYSSIGHAGYVLLGIYATGATSDGQLVLKDAVPFYLLTYMLATVGAFGVVAIVQSREGEDMTLERVSGLGRNHPVLAAMLTICLLSLAGIPPLAGFIGKFWLFKQVLDANPDHNLYLVIIAVLTSLVALYYYLRIALYVYFVEPKSPNEVITRKPASVTCGLLTFAVIVIGIYPSPMVDASRAAAETTVVRAVVPAVNEGIKAKKREAFRERLSHPEKGSRQPIRRGPRPPEGTR